jgi:hypothetical protein
VIAVASLPLTSATVVVVAIMVVCSEVNRVSQLPRVVASLSSSFEFDTAAFCHLFDKYAVESFIGPHCTTESMHRPDALNSLPEISFAARLVLLCICAMR